ncbi:MAG: Hsp20/alpha crystallin family protein [Planctomycetota bacterium]|nr:Hsp20/alpha crystallin family protein [Planctomycetota bacterium]
MQTDVKPTSPVPEKQESSTPEGTERTKARKVFVPLVDIIEKDHVLTLVADLPGVDQNGVEIAIEKNVLTIRGQIGCEIPEGFQLRYEEYGVGDYERSFTLPNEIDRDAVQASMKDGVLVVSLPKVKQAATRKVPVIAG